MNRRELAQVIDHTCLTPRCHLCAYRHGMRWGAGSRDEPPARTSSRRRPVSPAPERDPARRPRV